MGTWSHLQHPDQLIISWSYWRFCLWPSKYEKDFIMPNSDKNICGFIHCCQRAEDLQYSCQSMSHITWKPPVTVVYVLYACVEIFMIFRFHFHLSFFLSFSVCLSSLSLVVCENREEPRSWFQYLWWHQWPGEPLQTLRHGTTRPGLPANHRLPSFTSELPWKLLLVTAVFRLSVCLSVCGAAVDLVNFEPVMLYLKTFGK